MEEDVPTVFGPPFLFFLRAALNYSNCCCRIATIRYLWQLRVLETPSLGFHYKPVLGHNSHLLERTRA